MKKLIYLLTIPLLIAFMSCGNEKTKDSTEEIPTEGEASSIDYMNRNDLKAHIEKLEASLYEDTVAMNREKATELMEAYAMFATKHPDQEKSAEYMFKAGELAMGLNKSLDAIKYFSITYGRYTNYDKRPYALFLKAFVLENQLNDYEQASQTYQTFIEEYPDHPMYDDAKYSIQNMGKSPEELIKEFESRQKEQEGLS